MPTAASTLGDVRIERAGTQRWLVVNRSADQLWGPVRDFWQENGFLLAMDQANLGIMETDWAENRAKIPQDFIRSTLGKLLDSVYSTSERDRFRTRLERSASGGTEIYISHRGMIEVYNNKEKDQTVWQPRPTDPELEAEFLRRLMVKLGVPQEQAKTLVATGAAKPTSRVAAVGSTPVVQIDEGFDRAWRRVGLALDRTGFTVEDRDRAQGTYFVRYVEPKAGQAGQGLFRQAVQRLGQSLGAAEVPHQPQEPGRIDHRVGAQRQRRAGKLGQRPAHRAGDCGRPEVGSDAALQKPGQRQLGQRNGCPGAQHEQITHLLVDCGLGIRQLDVRLGQAGMLAEQIDAIFITHEHADHIGCARQLALRHRIPVWMSHGTYSAMGEPDFEGLLRIASDDVAIEIGPLAVLPFTVPHDAREPLQLTCSDGASTLGVLTDLGHATSHVLKCWRVAAPCCWSATTIRRCSRLRPIRLFSNAASAAPGAISPMKRRRRSRRPSGRAASSRWSPRT